MTSETKEILLGAILGVLFTPVAWFALCVFLQLDVLFK